MPFSSKIWTQSLSLFVLLLALHFNALAQRPNILVIVSDDQGYGDISAYQHAAPDVKTPNLDRLASKGILYNQAYSIAPVCSPARAGWMTGVHPANWDAKASFNCGLPKNILTIAERLKSKGYRTARIGKSDYSNRVHRQDIREYPLHHGYDHFLGFCAHGFDSFLLTKEIEEQTPDPRGHSAALGELFYNRGKKSFQEGHLTQIFTDEAISFLKEERKEPFFLTLAYNAVHHLIHQAPKAYLDKYGVKEIPLYDPSMGSYNKWFQKYIYLGLISNEEMRKYYLASLSFLDDQLGRVLDTLDNQDLAENTVIIYFSDNGGAPTTGACNRPLSGNKFTLWEGGIRIPFIYSAPGMKNAGSISDEVISALDVLPTCLKHAQLELPENLEGKVLNETMGKRDLFWRFRDAYAIRSGHWKLSYKPNGKKNREPTSGIIDRRKDRVELGLYNLMDDPAERNDQSALFPEVKQTLLDRYKSWSMQLNKNKNGRKN